MGSYGGIRLEGGRQLRKALADAGDDLSDLKDANRAAAETVAGAARAAAPARSGRLASTLRAAASKTAGTVKAGRKSVPYAACVHWGRMVWPSKTAVPAPPRFQHPAFVYPRLFITGPARDTEPHWVAEYLKALQQITERIESESHP